MQPERTETLFFSALSLPSEERSVFLLKACAANDNERSRIEELLRADALAAAFIKEPARLDLAAEKIGDYRLLNQLGEGGCGVVYLAEQLAPIKREVAFKIIKLGMDTKTVINRFEAERQALAMMDHPNIAKVFDAGATSTGRPYFVMELVRGIKITEYCEQCRLTLDERLELFIQVCQAIQHAHLKGIIHRDIKPSNVLVTLHDGKPIVKVIDFGVAKAMQGRLTDHTLHTFVDQLIGTPAYMSPEQTEPGALGVDTRSDVYSLGVLLYELITGVTPFDNDELMKSGLESMRGRIRDEDPTSPSKRIDAIAAEKHEHREASAGPHNSRRSERVRGDLDWIVMRCLEKERERRYQTVGELVDDLHRFISSHPLAARPRTLTYALAKLARRHWMAFAAGATALIVLSAATAVSTWQAWRALRAERLAQEAIASLVDIYSAADPFSNPEAEDMTREMLDRAARTAREELQQHPTVKAELLESVGRIHRRRREMDRALPLLREAVRVRRDLARDDTPALIRAMDELATALIIDADLQGARDVVDEAVLIAEGEGLERSLDYARLIHRRGIVLKEQAHIRQGLADLERSMALKRQILGPRHLEIGISLSAKAGALIWLDELSAAEVSARESVEILRASTGTLHPERLAAETILGAVLHYQERYVESELIFRELLEKRTRVYGRDSAPVAGILDFLGQSAAALGRMHEAEQHAREVVRTHERVFGVDNATTALFRVSLAHILARRRMYDEAERQVRQALTSRKRESSFNGQHVAAAEYVLGEILLGTGRLVEAEQILKASIGHWKDSKAPAWRAARSAGALSQTLLEQGRVAEAERLMSDNYQTVLNVVGPDAYTREIMRERLKNVSSASKRNVPIESRSSSTRTDSAAPAADTSFSSPASSS